MLNYKHFIGIDISKSTLDFCLLTPKAETFFYQCANDKKSIHGQMKEIFSIHQLTDPEVLFCAEHTGRYSSILKEKVLEAGYSLWMENPSEIKGSQGLQRGKDDKVDAKRIALYAKRFVDKAMLLKAVDPVFDQMAYLNSERNLLVSDRAKYIAQLKDEKKFADKKLYSHKEKRYKSLIAQLNSSIQEIDNEIEELIKNNEAIKNQYQTIIGIDGIGKQTAIQTLIATEGFTKFSNARKFACHAGCAPFKYHSGSSIRSRNKVSHRANKNLKRLFHMAALSAIKMEGEIRQYFLRKVAEGKNKMTVINTVRAKLIARIFSLINSNRKYEKIYINALA